MRSLLALATLLAVVPAASAEARRTVTVMTRDVYVGGDAEAPFDAIGDTTGTGALVAFANAEYALRQTVDATDFPARAQVLAAEIADHAPDLVGLQDVALWRRGPLDYSDPGEAKAEQVDQDFLQLLLDRLGDRYRVVATEEESDLEVPAFPAQDPNDPDGFDSRLTVRDVLLERVDSMVRILRSGSRSYTARRVDGPYELLSGFIWADFRLGGRRMRFITTQLDARSPRTALLQLEQVLGGAVRDARRRPTILVCGCNSDPEATGGTAADLPGRSVYRRVTQVLRDQWLAFAAPEQGYTASFGERLDDPDTTGIDRRTHFILGRRPAGHRIATLQAATVGTMQRTPTGLWPSDHLGVVAELRP